MRFITRVSEFITGMRDITKLRRLIPPIKAYKKHKADIRLGLRPYYDEYISNVSTADMSISLELAILLTYLCRVVQPRNILDLGSGFSSIVFRLYAISGDIKPSIWSVDDSPLWLEKTEHFISKLNLQPENLTDWDSFIQDNCTSFDFIFHDLGSMNFRIETLPQVLKLARQGGLIVLDDIHKKDYRDKIKPVLETSKIKYYSLRPLTRDKFGRYDALLVA